MGNFTLQESTACPEDASLRVPQDGPAAISLSISTLVQVPDASDSMGSDDLVSKSIETEIPISKGPISLPSTSGPVLECELGASQTEIPLSDHLFSSSSTNGSISSQIMAQTYDPQLPVSNSGLSVGQPSTQDLLFSNPRLKSMRQKLSFIVVLQPVIP